MLRLKGADKTVSSSDADDDNEIGHEHNPGDDALYHSLTIFKMMIEKALTWLVSPVPPSLYIRPTRSSSLTFC